MNKVELGVESEEPPFGPAGARLLEVVAERRAASQEGGEMTAEPVRSRTADADLFLPADGLTLLGEHPGSGYAGRRFLVGRSDGQVIHLSLLLYLIMAAIAEGGVDGGWSSDQIGARVGAASGQGLTADNVRYLVAGKLAPLGLIAAGGANRAPSAAQPPGCTCGRD